jgi:hypothetical protein
MIYSAMKSYLGKNPHFFTLSLTSDMPIKAAVFQLPPDTPVENICNSLERSGLNVINVRQMTNRTVPNGQTPVELLPLLCFILTRNINSQEIFNCMSLTILSPGILQSSD